ncbi:hypothetical protein acsn021_30260 [Anaerocolumna cellulosilytica]|uniref:Uncharacterized protein n=1 Tax=Anaerocolumna cellulosilytica TaxID=433286 RepID=A0A6S6R5T0_9FIRM|nr:hypothetical protein [Anaerocolumna cellulosilytica]BCJ95457.1 hypothetical protein acsn021_30260 [Anaerocolumna cellulosilytica]
MGVMIYTLRKIYYVFSYVYCRTVLFYISDNESEGKDIRSFMKELKLQKNKSRYVVSSYKNTKYVSKVHKVIK